LQGATPAPVRLDGHHPGEQGRVPASHRMNVERFTGAVELQDRRLLGLLRKGVKYLRRPSASKTTSHSALGGSLERAVRHPQAPLSPAPNPGTPVVVPVVAVEIVCSAWLLVASGSGVLEVTSAEPVKEPAPWARESIWI